MTQQISLTRGKVAEVDDRDYPRVRYFKWTAWRSGKYWYATTKVWLDGKYQNIALHRFIMDAPEGMMVVFKDGNALNCTRENMVLTDRRGMRTSSSKVIVPTTSRFLRVFWRPDRHKWRVTLHVNRHQIQVGQFDDEVQAAKEGDRAALKHYGPNARLNFEEIRNEALRNS